MTTKTVPLSRSKDMTPESIPFNTIRVQNQDASALSATTDVYTGVMSEGTLLQVRDRAFMDEGALEWTPLASSGTGLLFPDSVAAKTEAESHIRERPTTFKGPQQLDVEPDNADHFFERQIHPNGWKGNESTWQKLDKNTPFVGYPNPDYFTLYTDSIPTHNLQSISHSKLTQAMAAGSNGGYNHEKYLDSLGALLRSDAVPQEAAANIEAVQLSDGRGVSSDPRLIQELQKDYDNAFEQAKRLRVQGATEDERYINSAPGLSLVQEKNRMAEERQDYFNKLQNSYGISSSYTNPERYYT